MNIANIFKNTYFVEHSHSRSCEASMHVQITISLISFAIYWPSFDSGKFHDSMIFIETCSVDIPCVIILIDDVFDLIMRLFSDYGFWSGNYKLATLPKYWRVYCLLILRATASSSFRFTPYMEVSVRLCCEDYHHYTASLNNHRT